MLIKQESVSWKKIWEKKGLVYPKHPKLHDLLVLDGFDSGAGEFPLESWLNYINFIKKKLNIMNNTKILEVGCGSGAFLYPFHEEGVFVSGIDYSTSFISLCRIIMPNGNFIDSEANNIPLKDNYFDVVLSNSVFQYFRSYEYADKVLNEMIRLTGENGYTAVLDVNDASLENECESLRKEKIGEDEYNRKYSELRHRYYRKDWFSKIAEKYSLYCKIENQAIVNYGNSRFRYNVFLSKKNNKHS